MHRFKQLFYINFIYQMLDEPYIESIQLFSPVVQSSEYFFSIQTKLFHCVFKMGQGPWMHFLTEHLVKMDLNSHKSVLFKRLYVILFLNITAVGKLMWVNSRDRCERWERNV